MSRDDDYKKLKAQWLASGARSIEKSDQKIADIEASKQQLVVYFQSINPAIFSDSDVRRLIRGVGANILKEIPFEGKLGVQFKVAISYAKLKILSEEGASEIMLADACPFKEREKGFYPTYDIP